MFRKTYEKAKEYYQDQIARRDSKIEELLRIIKDRNLSCGSNNQKCCKERTRMNEEKENIFIQDQNKKKDNESQDTNNILEATLEMNKKTRPNLSQFGHRERILSNLNLNENENESKVLTYHIPGKKVYSERTEPKNFHRESLAHGLGEKLLYSVKQEKSIIPSKNPKNDQDTSNEKPNYPISSGLFKKKKVIQTEPFGSLGNTFFSGMGSPTQKSIKDHSNNGFLQDQPLHYRTQVSTIRDSSGGCDKKLEIEQILMGLLEEHKRENTASCVENKLSNKLDFIQRAIRR